MSLDDLLNSSPLDPVQQGIAYGPGYKTLDSLYRPYEWQMPVMRTPLPARAPFEVPKPEPPPSPTYDDCLLTPELFDWDMRNLNSEPET